MEPGGRYDAFDLECEAPSKLDKGGMFSGMFKRSSKSSVQDNLSTQSELSASHDSLSDNNNAKKGGVFGGVFRKSPKPSGDRTSSQDTFNVDRDLAASNDSLSEHSTTKEKSGMLSGIFRKSPKPGHKPVDNPNDKESESDSEEATATVNNQSNRKQNVVTGAISKLNPFRSGLKPQKSMDEAEASEDIHRIEKDKVGRSDLKKDTFNVDRDLAASNDSLSEHSTTKEKSGMLSGMFRKSPKPGHKPVDNPEKALGSDSEEMADVENGPGRKQNVLVGAMSKLNPFRTAAKNDKESEFDSEEASATVNNQSNRKQNVVTGAISKLNPFRSGLKPQKSMDEAEASEDIHRIEKDKVGHSDSKKVSEKSDYTERKERATGTPLIPPRPTEEELKNTVSHHRQKRSDMDNNQVSGNVRERERSAKTPLGPPRVPEKPRQELNTPVKQHQLKEAHAEESQDDSDECTEEKPITDENSKTKLKKTKKPRNPFMPAVAAKGKKANEKEQDATAADDHTEDESEDCMEDTPTEKAQDEEEGSAKASKPPKKKKVKRKNPFMPHVAVKGRTMQKKSENQGESNSTNPGESEGQKKSLMEQLNEFRFDRPEEDEEDPENLMEWWNTVEQWEDMPKDDDMTEKEEAKAFAVTAEKVQKGIRVFNKLFSERAEGLWQHVIDLHAIADGLDRFSKRTKIAQITGGSTSAVGGVATIAGLALAPVTMGTSLIVTAVGLGVATAGGLTSASAGISNTVNNSLDRKKVERIVEDYQEKMADLNKCMKFIKQGIENLRKFNLVKMKNHAYNRDFPGLNNIYEDGAMAGKAILINANEIMRVVQIANVAGSTAARAVQIASMATGVLTGLFVGMDIYFVAKDSRELKKGAKSEFAAKIREVAEQLHEGLVELNGIREELQCTSNPDNSSTNDPDNSFVSPAPEKSIEDIEKAKLADE